MGKFEWITEPFYIDEIRILAAKIATKAIVTIAGEEYTYPITKTVNRDGFFKHYIEVEDEPVGDVTEIVLVNENDVPLARGKGLIEKGSKGWQFAFKRYVLLEEGVADDGDVS